MTMTRREALLVGAATLALSALPAAARAVREPGQALKILVLGGTGFLGPHFVDAARARGHKLTLFNRGKTNPTRFSGEKFSDIEQLRGDRKSDLKALQGKRRWDAVLDTSAYIPADVTRSARLLGKRVNQYLLVSTVSVYAKMDTPGQDESAPLAALSDPTVTEVTSQTYGGLKALCEQAVAREMPGRTSIVRPGLIVGPGDNTDRFSYWPARADRGGEILAPGSPSDPTQFIDVRDLAAFLLRLLEEQLHGTFNADAPAGTLTMGELLAASRRAAGSSSTLTWVPAEFLETQRVRAWRDMPVWIPPAGDYAGIGRLDTRKAQAAGLACRPLDATVADTLAYWRSLPAERRSKPRAGLSPQREAEVLEAWHARGRREREKA